MLPTLAGMLIYNGAESRSYRKSDTLASVIFSVLLFIVIINTLNTKEHLTIVRYYMASSMSKQDERVLWLATWAGKMELSCPLGTTWHVYTTRKKFPESHMINPLLTKLVRSRWLDIGLVLFFASLWTLTSSRSINMQKKELSQYPAILTSRLINNPYILPQSLFRFCCL